MFQNKFLSALIKCTKSGCHEMDFSQEQNGILQRTFQLQRDKDRERDIQVWLNAPESIRYFYGHNEWGEKVNEKFRALGFYTETEPNFIEASELKTLHALSLPIGVLPLTAFRKASSASRSAIDLFSFLDLTGNKDMSPEFIHGMDVDVVENLQWYELLFKRLQDEVSRQVFVSLLNFRASWDLYHLRMFKDLRDQQYLEQFLQLGSEDVFYDVGAFTGDSYSSLVDYFGNFKSSYLFEPSPTNFSLMERNLGEKNGVTFLNMGLSNRKESMNISCEGSSSRLIHDGGEQFVAEKLDELDITPPTFIKVDIEGMEEKFLEGAYETLRKFRPKVAIAVYHNPYQLKRIVDLIDSAIPNSKIFLRHYTEGFTETILYIIPNKI